MKEKGKGLPHKTGPRLEVVLKCDSIGSMEAVRAAISEIAVPGVDISIVHSAVGDVSKSDVFLAETAGRLIIGFQVHALQGVDRLLGEHRVEVRLYEVIYVLVADIKTVAEGLIVPASQEEVIGSARVIALFKSSRKGIIVGCEVLDGFLAVGQHFRIVSAMGPIYSGAIESLHIRETTVQKTARGQQAGIKIRNFNRAKVGDLVESFRPLAQNFRAWEPKGQIIRK